MVMRKPDPNVMTKEDYDLYSRMYEEGRTEKEIKSSLTERNREIEREEVQRNIDYKKQLEQERVAKEQAEQDRVAADVKRREQDYINATKYDVLAEHAPAPVTDEKVGGWQNVWDVMKIALNPFSKTKIEVNPNVISNLIIKEGLEAAVNNPYTTALVASGLFTVAKLAVGAVVGKSAETVAGYTIGGGTASQYAVNTANAVLSKNMLVKAGFTVAAVFMIKDAIGTYPFAKFEVAETMQTLSMARWKAYEAGNQDLVDYIDQLQDEILNPQGWENIINKIPYANVQNAARRNIEAAELSRKVFNKLLEDEQIAQENGEDSDAKWERIRKQEAEQEKAAVDYYNSERKKLLLWEQELETRQRQEEAEEYIESRAEQRKLDKEAREQEAAFWAKEREKQRELEAADRKAIAEFWLAYKKQAQRLADESRPSQLNFGIL